MADDFTWSVNIGGTTDYVFRGVSQNNEDPTVQGGLDVGYKIFYAGIWASGVDETFTASEFEFDIYAGIKPVWGPATFDFGVIYYGYGNQNGIGLLGNSVDVDYWELKAGVSGEILPKLTAGAFVYYSPEATFETGETWTFEGGLAYALPKVWIFDPTISGTLGYLTASDNTFEAFNGFDEYVYWNAGLSLTVDKLTLDFRYWGTDIDVGGGALIDDLADDRFVFSAKVVLP
jgi:uncharacterized protein (TIGR02001 family)